MGRWGINTPSPPLHLSADSTHAKTLLELKITSLQHCWANLCKESFNPWVSRRIWVESLDIDLVSWKSPSLKHLFIIWLINRVCYSWSLAPRRIVVAQVQHLDCEHLRKLVSPFSCERTWVSDSILIFVVDWGRKKGWKRPCPLWAPQRRHSSFVEWTLVTNLG